MVFVVSVVFVAPGYSGAYGGRGSQVSVAIFLPAAVVYRILSPMRGIPTDSCPEIRAL